jgi:hypothetical protein
MTRERCSFESLAPEAVHENDPFYSTAVRDDGDIVASREGSVD